MPSTAASSPFGRIGIVGLGLMGGSVAAAVRAAWPRVHIVGVDRAEVLAEAERRRLIDRPADSIKSLASVDLIVLATPVPEILNLLPAVAELDSHAVVTDVGSTKRRIMATAAAAKLSQFIGSHPVAGAERPGLANARADLFARQPWLIVPQSPAQDAVVTELELFVRGIGAEPHRIDAESHDRTMAYVSHLPQLVSVALMNSAGRAVGDAGLGLSGRAFSEMTRVAASPADLWQGILATNADFVAEAAAAFVEELPTRSAQRDVTRWVEDSFSHAGEFRRRLAQVRPPQAG